MMPLTQEDRRQLIEAITESLAATRTGRQSWNSRINIAVAICAIASIFITVGMYWSRIASMEKREDVLELRMDRWDEQMRLLDLRVVNQGGDARVINVKLDAIQRDIDVLKTRSR